MMRKKDTMVYVFFYKRHNLRKLYAIVIMHRSNNLGFYGLNNLKGDYNELDYHDHFL